MTDSTNWIALDDIVAWERNPNEGDVGAIYNMIKSVGFRNPIGLWRDNITKNGNHRTKALHQLRVAGWEAWGPSIRVDDNGTWFVEYVDNSDLDEHQSDAWGIGDNRSTRIGHDDEGELAGLLKELQRDFDSWESATGFDGDELDELLADLAADFDVPEDAGAQIDKADELQEVWQVERGQLWIIPSITGDGVHKLLCGDSTKADDVSRVMGGEKADAVVTDPPYGINHDTNYKRFSGGISQSRNFGSPIINDERPFDPSHLLDFESVILWGANAYSNCLPVGSWLVWDKRHDGQDKLMSDGEVAFLNRGHGVYIFNHAWNGFVRDSERGKTLHPTQKPIELFKWCLGFIKSSIIYDPYGGSGPIMVACEQLQRQCRMIEISEKYCSVILQRMQDLGCTPERV